MTLHIKLWHTKFLCIHYVTIFNNHHDLDFFQEMLFPITLFHIKIDV